MQRVLLNYNDRCSRTVSALEGRPTMTTIQEARSTHQIRNSEPRDSLALPQASRGLSHFQGSAVSMRSGMGGAHGHHLHRGVEQPVARWAHNPEVGGSNPPPATKCMRVGDPPRAPSGAGAGFLHRDSAAELLSLAVLLGALLLLVVMA